MIKRRFYKFEHGDRDAPSESSSSSDSELEAEATEESEGEEEEDEDRDEKEEGNDNEDKGKVREKNQSCSSSSGYESEDSSANDVNLDSSGLPTSDDDSGMQHARQVAIEDHPSDAVNAELVNIQHPTAARDGDLPSDLPECAIKCKSVYRCRLCPRIVCLTEETLRAHLKSKRHARSEKLLKEGRLKLMLNDEGKVEGDTPQENQARTEEEDASYLKNKKGKKRQLRDLKRLKKKKSTKFRRNDLAKKKRI